ncbi:2-C-methyl-D-erythritol 2,4-cyclodiphosphate synthase [Treponema berlinense]|uniref:2-C-methyl-D-erythritol 2,4-cyclodiphosphate synthase n=1 Tax=Treponema berlinense TaxID=225004 RepID=UPI0026F2840D|nr:2-C-methyl-D-erythritol 2,4-cyclodiphosphate synthase [Treponema berlinense]
MTNNRQSLASQAELLNVTSPVKAENEGPALIVTAAGSSTRMGGIKKEYLPLEGGTVLSTAVKAFLKTLPFSLVAVTFPEKKDSDKNPAGVCMPAEQKCRNALLCDRELQELLSGKKLIFVPGGESRQASVFNALKKVKEHFKNSSPLVFIHDGARPFVTEKTITDTFIAAQKFGASAPGLQPTDTQKEIDENGFIKRHLVRKNLSAVQTPQVFMLDTLLKAHEKAAGIYDTADSANSEDSADSASSNREYTDDTEIWDIFAGAGRVKITEGDSKNKKITYKEDIFSAERKQTMIRTGLGYDKHPLVQGRPLMLGGIEFESDLGEAGHSDGDVLLHAVTDALLGACGLGDIGSFFPPEEPQWKDADSRMLLKTVWERIKAEGWQLENLDCVIALEKPKFLPRREEVIASIAEILEAEKSQVFVKAKTGEKLGDVGQRRAVEVWATCLLSK